jgi:hypothetical protein
MAISGLLRVVLLVNDVNVGTISAKVIGVFVVKNTIAIIKIATILFKLCFVTIISPPY